MLVMCARGVLAVPGAAAIMMPVLPDVWPSFMSVSVVEGPGRATRLTMSSQEASQRRARRPGADNQEVGLDDGGVGHCDGEYQVCAVEM